MDVTAEFTIEPFVEGIARGPRVAALDAVRGAGLEPAIGPFGSRSPARSGPCKRGGGQLIEAATEAGATTVSVQVTLCSRDG